MEEAAYLALIPQARNVAARYRLDDWQDLLHDALVASWPNQPTTEHFKAVARRTIAERNTRMVRWPHFDHLADPSYEQENIGRIGACHPTITTARKRVDALARGRSKLPARRKPHERHVSRTPASPAADTRRG